MLRRGRAVCALGEPAAPGRAVCARGEVAAAGPCSVPLGGGFCGGARGVRAGPRGELAAAGASGGRVDGAGCAGGVLWARENVCCEEAAMRLCCLLALRAVRVPPGAGSCGLTTD